MEQSRRRRVHLYSNELTEFCKDNKLYLELLRDHVEELKKLKQCDLFLKESKTESDIYRQSKAADPRNLSVMFTPVAKGGKDFFKAAAKAGEYEDLLTSHQHTENPFCYLCTTLEQHKKHMLKTEKRIHGKKRIPYEAPPPFVPPKPLPLKPESKECLFKVTVKTGVDIKAACSVPVFISLQGEEGKLRKVRLAKKFGSLGFFFDSGSTEVFHLRGPRIGRLERMTLTLDDEAEATATSSNSGAHHRRNRWLVESVVVKDYSLGLEYHFAMDRWLRRGASKRTGSRRDQVKLAPTATAKSVASSGRGVLVTTHTGRKATSGTDCRVFISLLGSSGAKGRHELCQPQDAGRIFRPGGKDVFELYVEEFGDLKGIRLELDTQNVRPPESSGSKTKLDRTRASEDSKTWFVDQVIVKDIKSGQKWLFTISDWLTEDSPLKEFWTVKNVDERLGTVYSQQTQYEIVTKTGQKDFAGTDSTIYLSLFDKENRRCDIELKDKDKTKFERGKTDTIVETARVIDTPERMKVSISGTGVAPDWFMDGIVVTKHLVTEEIAQYLQRLQFSNKMPDGLAKDKGKILFEALDQKQKKRQSSAERQSAKSKPKGEATKSHRVKKTAGSSSNDFMDGDIFGRGRTTKGRPEPTRRGGREEDSEDSEDTDASERGDDDSPSDADSVKSHDDYDPEHGTVRLPYAVQVSFTPRSKEEAWLKKDKTVELRASDAGKMLFKELRVRSDNENFKEMLEKERVKTDEKKRSQEKKQKKQQEQKRSAAKKPGSRSASRSRGGTSSSDESFSSNEERPAKRLADKQRPTRQFSATSSITKSGTKKPSVAAGRRDSSSDSDSTADTFGRPTKKPVSERRLGAGSVDKPAPNSKVGADDRKQPPRASASKEVDSVRGGSVNSAALRSSTRSPRSGWERDSLASKKGLDHVDYGMGDRARDGLDLRSQADGRRPGLDKDRGKMDLDRGKDRSPLDLDRGRGRLDLDKAQKRSPRDLDRGGDLDRGRDLDRSRDRLDFDKSKDRSAMDLDRGRGRLAGDKGQDRSPRDLDKGRGRLDSGRDGNRSPRDLDRGRGQDRSALDLDSGRGRLDLDKGRGKLDFDKSQDRSPRDLDRVRRGLDSSISQGRSPLDLDGGRGRLDYEKDKDSTSRNLDRGRGRFDLDNSQSRSPLDIDRGRNRLDFDKGRDRGQQDLDKGRSRPDLDKGQGRPDFDKGLDRSPRDLDKGRGRLDFDKGLDRSPRDLDKGRGRLDFDKGLDRSPRDLDKGRGRLDFDKGKDRSPLDMDRSRGRLDRDKDLDRNPRDQDRGMGRLDLDRRGARAAPVPLDKPRILVTASDGRTADPGAARARQRSFNLD